MSLSSWLVSCTAKYFIKCHNPRGWERGERMGDEERDGGGESLGSLLKKFVWKLWGKNRIRICILQIGHNWIQLWSVFATSPFVNFKRGEGRVRTGVRNTCLLSP